MVHDFIPTSKLSNNLKSLEKPKIPVVLVAPGSISPIHKMHVQMLEAAKQFLERISSDEQFQTTQNNEDSKEKTKGALYEVVGGYLSPAHESYVNNKLGAETISFAHRSAMCELALAESSWIDVSVWEGKQPRFCYWNNVMNNHNSFLQKKFSTHPDLKLMFVCGADLASKSGGLFKGVAGYPVVVVGRGEDTQFLVDSSNRHEPGKFYLVTKKLEPISSTEIRTRLQNGGNLEELMHPAAAAYLRTHVVYKNQVTGQTTNDKEGKEEKEEEEKEEEEEEKEEEEKENEEAKTPPPTRVWACTLM